MATAGLPLADELALFQRLDADVVGLEIRKLHRTGWEHSILEVRRSGLAVEYLVLPCDVQPNDTDGWDRYLRLLEESVGVAAALSTPTIYVTSGPSASLNWNAAADLFVDRMTPAVAAAADRGVILALEHTMSYRSDLSFTHTVRDAGEIVSRAGMGLVVDLYSCWQEGQLAQTLGAHLHRVQLLQLSDFRVGTLTFPNRWVPGDGDLPLTDLLRTVLNLGYRGPLDLELMGPAIEAEGAEPALRRGLEWLGVACRAAQL